MSTTNNYSVVLIPKKNGKWTVISGHGNYKGTFSSEFAARSYCLKAKLTPIDANSTLGMSAIKNYRHGNGSRRMTVVTVDNTSYDVTVKGDKIDFKHYAKGPYLAVSGKNKVLAAARRGDDVVQLKTTDFLGETWDVNELVAYLG
jgi:hypothetical protein